MPLDFRRSWSDEAVERFRDSWVRFVESEMQPNDAEAQGREYEVFSVEPLGQ
jgi:acyl-CoA dehydrogenase